MQRIARMHTPHFVSAIGSTTAGFAKRVGSTTADLAGSVGTGTAKLAKRIGPKRGLIGLAAIGALVGGGIVLARFLKRRRFEQESMEASEAERPSGSRKRSRGGKQDRAQEATSY